VTDSAFAVCPACRKAVPSAAALRPKMFPFCNERCRLVDLSKWLNGEHVLPSPIDPEDEEAIQEVLAARLGES